MTHTILFTGHMIDKPDRTTPRFPSSKQGAVAQAIRTVLQRLASARGVTHLRGIAGAACGGDTLFHEACRRENIPSEIFLAIPVDAFEQTSVNFAGPDWIARYRRLVRELPVHILHLKGDAGAPDSVWEEANRWMLGHALAAGRINTTLIALWDGLQGDGPGSAGQMIAMAGTDIRKEMIDITRL